MLANKFVTKMLKTVLDIKLISLSMLRVNVQFSMRKKQCKEMEHKQHLATSISKQPKKFKLIKLRNRKKLWRSLLESSISWLDLQLKWVILKLCWILLRQPRRMQPSNVFQHSKDHPIQLPLLHHMQILKKVFLRSQKDTWNALEYNNQH